MSITYNVTFYINGDSDLTAIDLNDNAVLDALNDWEDAIVEYLDTAFPEGEAETFVDGAPLSISFHGLDETWSGETEVYDMVEADDFAQAFQSLPEAKAFYDAVVSSLGEQRADEVLSESYFLEYYFGS